MIIRYRYYYVLQYWLGKCSNQLYVEADSIEELKKLMHNVVDEHYRLYQYDDVNVIGNKVEKIISTKL
jgi:hypothetical protein